MRDSRRLTMLIPTENSNIHVEIVRENGIAQVYVHAPLYKNKCYNMSMSWVADQFTNEEILKDKDFTRVLQARYKTKVRG
jgi:hypothetical protein